MQTFPCLIPHYLDAMANFVNIGAPHEDYLPAPGDEARPRISSNVAVYAEAQLTYSLWGRTVLNHNKTVLGFHCSFTVIP